VPAGTVLAVLGQTAAGDWVRLSADDGAQGWAAAELLALNVPPETIAVVDTPAPPSTSTPTPEPPAAADDEAVAPARVGSVLAVGDSVMLGARSALERSIPTIDVEAAVSRQVDAAIQVVRARRAAGTLGDVVVLQVGNNGTFSTAQFDGLMQLLPDVRRVVFVTLKEDRAWEGPNNAVIVNGVRRYPNTVLADWHAVSAGRPELFYSDGIHLRPAGAQLYANLISAALAAL
jgi:hypothetical protein